ncbi:ATP-dependent helicase [Peptacetobacter sp.]|uniref:ATP-dependent helicase n=1 Tax=Peptacetobacter sp. TaxID=2991975 RepID=UPI002E76577D|nr:ATP-dependent helicase [Peptacetobacter sp.]MEE0450612.1 ATP-dependent helicase [Peptacetobacter sp.]
MRKITYREDQVPIMEYKSGTMAVPAVPGAGKTFIVTRLVTELLENNINGKEKILILTYMNSAVNNFKGRIKKLLNEKYGEDAEIEENLSEEEINEIKRKNKDTLRRLNNSYEVMTIHSLATKIIKENPESAMLNEEFMIADDAQRSIILNECIESYLSTEKGRKYFYYFINYEKAKDKKTKKINEDKARGFDETWKQGFFDLVTRSISKLKYNGITPDILNERVNEDGYKGIMVIVSPIYEMYCKRLKLHGLLDFDDLLINAHKIVRDDDAIREKLNKKYKYIFEDECQDSNEIQGKIIKLIGVENPNIVRVGDINQSISGTFSESNPKFFREFIESADCCHRMDMSNRSSKDILELANLLVDYTKNSLPEIECRDALEDMKIKTVEKGKGYKENPEPKSYTINTKWLAAGSFDDEIRETIRFVEGIKRKYPDKSIGILAPYNKDCNKIAAELKKHDLEFENLSSSSEKMRKVIDDIANILDFIIDNDNIDKLMDIIGSAFIKEESEEGKVDFLNIFKKFTTDELIYNFDEIDLGIVDDSSSIFVKFKNALEKIQEIMDYSWNRADLLVLFIRDRLDITEEEMAIAEYVAFYIKYLKREDQDVDFEYIVNVIKDRGNSSFRHILDITGNINGYEPTPGSVTVCTNHKSKGMEWDCVFMLKCTKYQFPSDLEFKLPCQKYFLKEKYNNPEALVASEIEKLTNGLERTNFDIELKLDQIREKIRLFYVSVTRAKEMLIISASVFNNDEDKKKKYPLKQEKSEYFRLMENQVQKRRAKQ